MAKTKEEVTEVTADTPILTSYAVFGINEYFTLGLWALSPDQVPEGSDAFLRPASEEEVAMARGLVKTLNAIPTV